MGRLKTAALRERFAVSHGLMRRWLVEISDEPLTAQWQVGPHGKPACAVTPRWHFNMSHSSHLGLFAVTEAMEIGVDIECARSLNDASRLAQRILSEEEKTQWQALDTADQERALLRYWTRKEAVLKALGWGLSVEPDRVCVGLEPLPRRVNIAMPDTLSEGCAPVHAVHVCDLSDIPGAVAAFAWVASPCTD